MLDIKKMQAQARIDKEVEAREEKYHKKVTGPIKEEINNIVKNIDKDMNRIKDRLSEMGRHLGRDEINALNLRLHKLQLDKDKLYKTKRLQDVEKQKEALLIIKNPDLLRGRSR